MTQATGRTAVREAIEAGLNEAAGNGTSDNDGLPSEQEVMSELRDMDRQNSDLGRRTPKGANGAGDSKSGGQKGAKDSDSEEAAPGSNGKRPGLASVLSYLEEHVDEIPGGAEAVRSIQASQTRQGQRASTAETELREVRERMARLEGRLDGGGKAEEEAEDPVTAKRRALLARVPRDQKEVMDAYMQEMGVMTRAELEAEQAEEQSQAIADQDTEQGLKMFGDDFGSIGDDGEFRLNPEVAPEAAKILRQVTSDDHGITPFQLYVLAKYADLIKSAEEKGKTAAAEGQTDETRRRVGGSTVRRGAVSQRGEAQIYNKGESTGSVIKRALLEAARG